MCGILTISGKKQIIDFWSIKFIRVREGLKKVNRFRGIFCKGGGGIPPSMKIIKISPPKNNKLSSFSVLSI